MPTATTARRIFDLLEPVCLVTFFADECNAEMAALGHRTYWDGYFASRAAPLGRVPAQVVHAAFYSFADGEAARHIPSAWETISPEASIAARQRGSTASLRRILGDELADSPGLARAADLTTKAATSAPTEGRMMYAGMHHRDAGGHGIAMTNGDRADVEKHHGAASYRLARWPSGLPEDRRYLVDGVKLSCGNRHHQVIGGVIGQR